MCQKNVEGKTISVKLLRYTEKQSTSRIRCELQACWRRDINTESASLGLAFAHSFAQLKHFLIIDPDNGLKTLLGFTKLTNYENNMSIKLSVHVIY